MKDVTEVLNERKQDFDKLEAPENMEERLLKALENKSAPKRFGALFGMKVAAILIAVIIIGYNFDTLAFYGKRIIGYDTLMSGTLENLNKLGKGQTIGKSFSFKNGVKFTLDGIMLDENQLIAFYTIRGPKEFINGPKGWAYVSSVYMEGMFDRNIMERGYGDTNGSDTEIRYVGNFKAPLFFEKSLSFCFGIQEREGYEQGKIDFKLDRSKAMGHTLKRNLRESIKTDGVNVRFQSILATPTRTTIKGELQNIFELGYDVIRKERVRPGSLVIKLYADGKEVEAQGGEVKTDMNGITFRQDYDVLPNGLKSLKIELVSFGADHDVKVTLPIEKSAKNSEFKALNQKLTVNSALEKEGKTYVTITTERSVLLSKVHLIADEKRVELQRTLSRAENKLRDGTISKTRTLEFSGTGKVLKLDISRMYYEKNYNKSFEVPIN